MKHAKHKIKHDMGGARKTENIASVEIDAYFDKIGRTDEDFSAYTSKTEKAEMADWSERKIAARQSKDEFTAMIIPHAEKHTLVPTESALEPLQVEQSSQNNVVTRSKDPYWQWIANISDIEQISDDQVLPESEIDARGLSAFVHKNYGSRFVPSKPKVALKPACNANPVVPLYVPREHWLDCALASLGFRQ